MGLTELQDGVKAVISHIEGGRRIRQNILDLGIVPGVPVTIVKKADRSPMLLSLMGRKVVLDQRMASRIHVR